MFCPWLMARYGELKLQSVEQAMRTLSKVLTSSGAPKKKIYPTNFVEPYQSTPGQEDKAPFHTTYHHTQVEDDDALTVESLEQHSLAGDADALTVQQFEKDFQDMMQDASDLQAALLTYQEAGQRIVDRGRSRGFWPSKGATRDQGHGKSLTEGRTMW